jgi:lysophospholipase L1-like esterase
MKLDAGSKLVMIGDSITDAGRTQPVGEGLFDPLGRGYVTLVEAMIGAVYPGRGIRIVNMGTSGNTVRDLEARWQRDVIDLKPDYLSVMIGINDVWRQFDSPRQTEWHVSLEEYDSTLRRIIGQVQGELRSLILMTPFYIEANRQDPMRARMGEYGDVVRRLAPEVDATLVDTQAAFDAVLEHYYPATLAWDRIHPNQTGHMVLARAFLKAIGFEW